jgi:hypothetical protein
MGTGRRSVRARCSRVSSLPLPDGAEPPPAWPVSPTGPWAIWTPRLPGVRYRHRRARARVDHTGFVPGRPPGPVLPARERRRPPDEDRVIGGDARNRARFGARAWLVARAPVSRELVGPVVRRPGGSGCDHAPLRGHVKASGSDGARIGYSRLGLLAYRPRLPRRAGADATGTRGVRGPVLHECNRVGMGAVS